MVALKIAWYFNKHVMDLGILWVLTVVSGIQLAVWVSVTPAHAIVCVAGGLSTTVGKSLSPIPTIKPIPITLTHAGTLDTVGTQIQSTR